MRLTPKEQEKLMLHMAGNLAKERKERGVKLNYVESLAYISSELLELARDGKTVVELMQLGTKILSKEDVMDGVADMLEEVAYGHFPRPSGPRSPARQGHIKRPVLRLAEPSFLRPANQCC